MNPMSPIRPAGDNKIIIMIIDSGQSISLQRHTYITPDRADILERKKHINKLQNYDKILDSGRLKRDN